MYSYHISYQDVQYGDIDHMDRHIDFTYNKKKYAGLPEFVRSLKKDGLRYIIILVSVQSYHYDFNSIWRFCVFFKDIR